MLNLPCRQPGIAFAALPDLDSEQGISVMAMVLGCVWDQTPGGCRSLHLSCDTWPPVLQRMGEVPGTYIAGALVPALIITVLFYFDHSVSSQLAQARPCGHAAHFWGVAIAAVLVAGASV